MNTNEINSNKDHSVEKQLYYQRVTNIMAQKTGRRTVMLLKKREKDVYRRLLFVLVIVVFLILFLLVFGLQILVKIAEFLDIVRNTGRPSLVTLDTIPPFPPRIDSLPTATNSARLQITGQAESGSKVEIFVNGRSFAETTVDETGKFKFGNVILKEGENQIEAFSFDRTGNKSQTSQRAALTFDKIPPFLEISEPQNNTSYSGQTREVKVRGKTEPEAVVIVAGSLAIINSEGDFSYNFLLNSGENKIQIEATDPAGNKSITSRTIYYNP